MKQLLRRTYFPEHSENKMASEGEVAKARTTFLKYRFPNLDFLLAKRYGWMNAYLLPHMNIIEVGCGAGFSPLYLSPPPF